MITHGACGQSWTGLRRAHCAACCTTFNSDSAAEKHRVGRHGIDRRCADPATVGLVAVEQPWGICWQAPGSDLRFTGAPQPDSGHRDAQEALSASDGRTGGSGGGQ